MPSSTSCSTRVCPLRVTCSIWRSILGVAQKSGAWFSYGDVRLGQGRENSKRFIRENPDLFDEIRREVLKAKDVPVFEDQKLESEKAGSEAEVK